MITFNKFDKNIKNAIHNFYHVFQTVYIYTIYLCRASKIHAIHITHKVQPEVHSIAQHFNKENYSQLHCHFYGQFSIFLHWNISPSMP